MKRTKMFFSLLSSRSSKTSISWAKGILVISCLIVMPTWASLDRIDRDALNWTTRMVRKSYRCRSAQCHARFLKLKTAFLATAWVSAYRAWESSLPPLNTSTLLKPIAAGRSRLVNKQLKEGAMHWTVEVPILLLEQTETVPRVSAFTVHLEVTALNNVTVSKNAWCITAWKIVKPHFT